MNLTDPQDAPGRRTGLVRAYAPEDEAAVRRICFDTALYGQPMAPLLADSMLVSHALIGYHLRYEPSSLWVAEDEGVLVGYAAGCADHHRYGHLYGTRILPYLIVRCLFRGLWLHLHLLGRLARLAPAIYHWRAEIQRACAAFPAHCHVNVAATHRGRGLGSELLTALIDDFQRRGITGLHASTLRAESVPFFEKSGFRVLRSMPLPSLVEKGTIPAFLLGRHLP